MTRAPKTRVTLLLIRMTPNESQSDSHGQAENEASNTFVMAGLDPAIHQSRTGFFFAVDGRHKAGHDNRISPSARRVRHRWPGRPAALRFSRADCIWRH